MKRPDIWDEKYGSIDFFDHGLYIDDVGEYIDYLEKELDFYRRGGAQIEDEKWMYIMQRRFMVADHWIRDNVDEYQDYLDRLDSLDKDKDE